MDKNVELLAPAGDWESFTAAVENGADAVYLGGTLFNARQFAANFDVVQLKKALDFAHIRGVRVYLAMNTLMTDNEMKQAVDFVEEAYSMGIDGIIVQDLGFAGLLRKVFPDISLHASTQMTVYNLAGVQVLEQLGFKRAVLARELSVEEIKYISKNTKLELEIFVHGALCISYSGQCLMSSIIGGRSGNRGKCAQPCRLPYELVKENSCTGTASTPSLPSVKGHLLSPKDICSIEILKDVVYSGAKSLKIEGRMKSPEYVATVVRLYRKYIDSIISTWGKGINVDRQDMKELAQVFNRGGFSKGYIKGKCGSDMMCYEKPKNWGVYLGEVLSFNTPQRAVKIKLEDSLSIGDGVEIWNGESESPGTIVTRIGVNEMDVDSASAGEQATAGYINGNISKGDKVYKTSDKALNTSARESFEGRFKRRAAIEGKIIIRKNSPVQFIVWDGNGNEATASGELIPQVAINRPLDRERIIEQLNKTGATAFEFEKIEIELDEGLTTPISEINNIRRRALEDLELKRVNSYSKKISEESIEKKNDLLHFPGNSRSKTEKTGISLYFYKVDANIDFKRLNVDRIYLPFNLFMDESKKNLLEKCRGKDREGAYEVFAALPTVTKGNYDKLIGANLAKAVEWGINGLLIGNLGSIEWARKFPTLKTMGDHSLNVFNSFSAGEFSALGISGITLSPELNLSQLADLKDMSGVPGLIKEAVVYGRIAVMTSEYCPVGSVAGGLDSKSVCKQVCKNGTYKLKDRLGIEFPVLCDRIDCRSTIFNSNVLFVPDSLDRIKTSGVDRIRLNITDEKAEEINEIVDMHREIIENGAVAISRYSSLIERVKSAGFTKGHYFRGV